MPFIQLQKVGKIYVSDNNISVGIRGIDLSFEKGEFVAVTGESGSGKSTLLNVISGMDTYEEGELLIEGEPTSHFVQSDWEEYRKNYISFIFQDYNIVDSFTVLENVELALMHVRDHAERRRRAVELLDRVGMKPFLKKRGSKLSGGQKQRTVIARALAKDSPVILADEPTGNLDSKTSAEILDLLKEVSKGKLVIVVTHDFGQIEPYATRHIRIHDGAVEYDVQTSSAADPVPETAPQVRKTEEEGQTAWNRLGRTLQDSMRLGWVRFKAKPKLSFFLCLLMIVAAIGVFAVTSFSASSLSAFDPVPFFTHQEGRVILTKPDGSVITKEEYEALAKRPGVLSGLRFDTLLDRPLGWYVRGRSLDLHYTTTPPRKPDTGRLPEKDNEIALFLPLYAKGAEECPGIGDTFDLLNGDTAPYTVVGLGFDPDNTKPACVCMTGRGFEILSCLEVLPYSLNVTLTTSGDSVTQNCSVGLLWSDGQFWMKKIKDAESASVKLEMTVRIESLQTGRETDPASFETVSVERTLTCAPAVPGRAVGYGETLYVDPQCVLDLGHAALDISYRQTSLFYANDREAEKAARSFRSEGYHALASTETRANDDILSLSVFGAIGLFLLWLFTVAFLTLFISLATTRAIMSTQGDLSILRSMGIPVPVIRTSVFIQTLLPLIPAYLSVLLFACFAFLFPPTNAQFTYLRPWAYLVIAAALILISVMIARRYIRKLFGQSVKKALKGENRS